MHGLLVFVSCSAAWPRSDSSGSWWPVAIAAMGTLLDAVLKEEPERVPGGEAP